ncbi:MAG: PHP domain-containing protein [Candidatus Gracilibacteria bacterium]|nr:PHP domain-containing protein [Candidatus Gracilibacteria bacterium]
MNIDMHFHSNISDGKNSTDEHIKIAKEKQISFLALTDHDKVVPTSFKEECKKNGIDTCDSVEISARNTQINKSLHLTLYAEKISDKTRGILSNTIDNKIILIQKQIEFLNQKGFIIDYDDFLKYSFKKGKKVDALNKFDIARYVYLSEHNKNFIKYLNSGIELSVNDFYKRFLKREGDMYSEYGYEIEEYEPDLEICKQIKSECNGILSIAHPNVTFKGGIQEFYTNLPQYIIEGGINAIEINSKATRDWVEAILKAKDKYGLFVTFGSDNHKIGNSDERHGNFGEQNPNLDNKQIEDFSNAYKGHLLDGTINLNYRRNFKLGEAIDFWEDSFSIDGLQNNDLSEALYKTMKISGENILGFINKETNEYTRTRYPRKKHGILTIEEIKKSTDILKKIVEEKRSSYMKNLLKSGKHLDYCSKIGNTFINKARLGLDRLVNEKKHNFRVVLGLLEGYDMIYNMHSIEEVLLELGDDFRIQQGEILSGSYTKPTTQSIYYEPAAIIEGDIKNIEKIYNLAFKFHQERFTVEDYSQKKAYTVETEFCKNPD